MLLTMTSPRRAAPGTRLRTFQVTEVPQTPSPRSPIAIPRVAKATGGKARFSELSLNDQHRHLTEYKKHLEKKAVGELDSIDEKLHKIWELINEGHDPEQPFDAASPGRAPDSDMKHHGKKRSCEARARAQRRNKRRARGAFIEDLDAAGA